MNNFFHRTCIVSNCRNNRDKFGLHPRSTVNAAFCIWRNFATVKAGWSFQNLDVFCTVGAEELTVFSAIYTQFRKKDA
jgi:hypothetical protein